MDLIKLQAEMHEERQTAYEVTNVGCVVKIRKMRS